MGTIAGYDGKVVWGTAGTIVSDVGSNVHSWKLDLTGEALDNTDFTSTGWKTFMAGLKQWGGSLEAYCDASKPITIASVGTSTTIKLYIDGTKYYNGTALCTGVHPSVGVEGIETQTIDFQGTGALTLLP